MAAVEGLNSSLDNWPSVNYMSTSGYGKHENDPAVYVPIVTEYRRPNAGEITPIYLSDCIGNKSDAAEADEMSRVKAWDYHDPDKGVKRWSGCYDTGIPKPKITCRYVRYRYAGIKGNAYMRLRHDTAAIRCHYTRGRIKTAKQAIFVHRAGWNRRLLYGTSRIVRIEGKVSQRESVIAKVVKPVAYAGVADMVKAMVEGIASGGITMEEVGRRLRSGTNADIREELSVIADKLADAQISRRSIHEMIA